jgi:hypothetical protein
MNAFGLSKGGFCHVQDKFLNAALDCDALDMNLPAESSEWKKVRKGFASKSWH